MGSTWRYLPEPVAPAPVPLAGVPRPRPPMTDTRSGVLRARVVGRKRQSPVGTR